MHAWRCKSLLTCHDFATDCKHSIMVATGKQPFGPSYCFVCWRTRRGLNPSILPHSQVVTVSGAVELSYPRDAGIKTGGRPELVLTINTMTLAIVRVEVFFHKRATLTVRVHRLELLQGFLRVLVTPVTSITAHFGTSSFKRDKPAERCPQKGYKEYRMYQFPM